MANNNSPSHRLLLQNPNAILSQVLDCNMPNLGLFTIRRKLNISNVGPLPALWPQPAKRGQNKYMLVGWSLLVWFNIFFLIKQNQFDVSRKILQETPQQMQDMSTKLISGRAASSPF